MWKHKKAAAYIDTLKSLYGKPDVYSDKPGGMAIWYKPTTKIIEIIIRDENISHSFPMPHTDFVYASMKIEVPPKAVARIAKVTGSITVDGLKGTVTARCGAMIKNAISLGFVQDLVAGKIGAGAKEEYGRRIKANEFPSWYKDKLGEAEA